MIEPQAERDEFFPQPWDRRTWVLFIALGVGVAALWFWVFGPFIAVVSLGAMMYASRRAERTPSIVLEPDRIVLSRPQILLRVTERSQIRCWSMRPGWFGLHLRSGSLRKQPLRLSELEQARLVERLSALGYPRSDVPEEDARRLAKRIRETHLIFLGLGACTAIFYAWAIAHRMGAI
jgi:hypothetical protein